MQTKSPVEIIQSALPLPLPDLNQPEKLGIVSWQPSWKIKYGVTGFVDQRTLEMKFFVFARIETPDHPEGRIFYLTPQHVSVGRYLWRWLVQNKSTNVLSPTIAVPLLSYFSQMTEEQGRQAVMKLGLPKQGKPQSENKKSEDNKKEGEDDES